MTRVYDVIFSFLGLILLSPILIILMIIGFFDTGSPMFKQKRIGKNKKPFYLIKLRSMHLNTASVPTHLANVSSITPYGRFLRRSKLDEIPQLWNVLVGEMSLVGPRPNLFSQEELIRHRSLRNVYDYKPGITGLAQIKKIDMSDPAQLAYIDAKMIQEMNQLNYFKLIFLTVCGKGGGDRIKN